MKFADDQYLTPTGIWLKRTLIRIGKLMRTAREKLWKGEASP